MKVKIHPPKTLNVFSSTNKLPNASQNAWSGQQFSTLKVGQTAYGPAGMYVVGDVGTSGGGNANWQLMTSTDHLPKNVREAIAAALTP